MSNEPIEPWELRDFYRKLLDGNESVLEAVRALKSGAVGYDAAYWEKVATHQIDLANNAQGKLERVSAVVRDFITLAENPTTTIEDVRAYAARLKALLNG